MNQSPRVSVILPVYNDAEFLEDAVRSILEQTYDSLELIAIDDGSTDHSSEILQFFGKSDSRMRIFRQANRGLGATLNRGIGIANGELIARQDADDRSHVERLTTQVTFLDAHPDVVLLGSFARVMDDRGRVLYLKRLPKNDDELRGEIETTSPFVHGSVIMRKSAVTKVGGYRDIAWLEDLLLWRALAQYGKLANVETALYDYRVSPTNLYVPRRLQSQVASMFLRHWPNDALTSDDLEMLEAIRFQITPHIRRVQYHLNIAKGVMVSSGDRHQARSHLIRAIQASPLMPELWVHLIFTLLPSKVSKWWLQMRRGRNG